jgi:hypothetical protein
MLRRRLRLWWWSWGELATFLLINALAFLGGWLMAEFTHW